MQALLAAVVLAAPLHARAGDPFLKPTPEELSMTSLPGYPGAAAVVLLDEVVSKDDMHEHLHYRRLKILTEEGKKYANVELGFVRVGGSSEYADLKTLDDISARTIHADGTIIPFTGKPYLKTLDKLGDLKLQQKIFTLPAVEVGSILEYRYATRYDENLVEAPRWYLQQNLYVKSAHYEWWPSTQELSSEDGVATSINYFKVLPVGATVQRRILPGRMGSSDQQIFELRANDVAPQPSEEFMPPIGSVSYRVLFYYTPFHTGQEFWKAQGGRWSHRTDSFVGPNDAVRAATQTIVAGAQSDDDKLRKIYAAVMAMENTSYTRGRNQQENRADGVRNVNNTGDVLRLKRGDPVELTELFVGMARAAGLKAYVMLVPERDERVFLPGWLSFQQFDNAIAIVNVGGQEKFFDPGARYCAYGHLAWEHTLTSGLRQTDNGSDIASTPGEPYTNNRTNRMATLGLQPDGSVDGTMTFSFEGAPALYWRHKALRGDEESFKKALQDEIQRTLPKSMEVTVLSVNGLEEYEKPLTVGLRAKGLLATASGKRVMVPVNVFTAGRPATFPHDKRETAVDFHYPQVVNDTMRIVLPDTLQVEGAPDPAKFEIPKTAVYAMKFANPPKALVMQRSYAMAATFVPLDQFPTLKTFYGQFEGKDQDSVVLKTVPAPAAAAANAAGGGQ